MIKFIRTNSDKWNNVNKDQYKDSIVFIEDAQQVCVNNVNYFSKKLAGVERVEFSTSSISIEPNKFYFCNEILNELDITLLGEGIRNYFVEFICDNTCVILPSNIKWENGIVPDFTQTAIMTIKIQDDTAYLIDCRKLYYVSYSAPRRTQPNRDDAFGSNIIAVTDNKFILDGPATEIKEGAFEGNNDLISIEIPSTVAKIESQAFSNCPNLETIYYKGDLSDWNKIEISDDWKKGTDVESVECTDGSVYLGPCVIFTAQQDNSTIGLTNLSTNQTLEYSRDRSNWSNMNTSTNISLNNGDKVYIKGVLSGDNTWSNYTRFKMTGKIAASGNCNAIWNYEDLNAPLKKFCGCYIFFRCNSLTTAPELPATELADYCYWNMFSYCSSLTTAPELPATTLAYGCYWNMFWECTSLTTASELPATTLTSECYNSMFAHCISLTTAPELPATALEYCCYNYMFYNCISLITAPELPATELADSCYYCMFQDCTNLNYIKCLATDISATNCTSNWVNGVANTGTFIKHPDMYDWPTGASGIPSGWEVVDAEV